MASTPPGFPSLHSVTQDAVRPVVGRTMNDTAAVLSAAPSDHRSSPCREHEALYRQHHARLLRAVAARVSAPAETIEDACSFAWLQLMRTEPEHGPRLFAWLRTVATREAIRLVQRDGRFDCFEPELAVDPRQPEIETVLEAREAARAVTSLRERQSRILLLKLAGYSYREIAERTGDSVLTVERQLLRARGRLRGNS